MNAVCCDATVVRQKHGTQQIAVEFHGNGFLHPIKDLCPSGCRNDVLCLQSLPSPFRDGPDLDMVYAVNRIFIIEPFTGSVTDVIGIGIYGLACAGSIFSTRVFAYRQPLMIAVMTMKVTILKAIVNLSVQIFPPMLTSCPPLPAAQWGARQVRQRRGPRR